VFSAEPHGAVLTLLPVRDQARVRRWTIPEIPQGSLAFAGMLGYVPVSIGMQGFAMAEIDTAGRGFERLQRYASVWSAVDGVIPALEPYGISVDGLIPLKAGPLPWTKLQRWPHPMLATVTTVETGCGPWVLDGSSQGYWFNIGSDHFGQAFAVSAPAGAFSRAVVPWS
jgi:hypothetical protein